MCPVRKAAGALEDRLAIRTEGSRGIGPDGDLEPWRGYRKGSGPEERSVLLGMWGQDDFILL